MQAIANVEEATMRRETVRNLLATSSVDDGACQRLGNLHQLELTCADVYEWPWQRWPALLVEMPEFASSVAGYLDPAAMDDLEGLERSIFKHAEMLRRPVPDLHAIAKFLANPPAIIQKIPSLRPEFLFELALMAFVDKRWRIVAAAAVRLLEERPWGRTGTLQERMADLLFEMLFFAEYRPAMPSYVKDPDSLLGKLDGLAEKPFLKDVLKRNGIAAQIFTANRLAMHGRLSEALPLYETVNRMAGFSSPVIRQHQTVYDASKVFAADNAALEAWYHGQSDTRHVQRHMDRGHALLVGCNQHYFDLYAELYLEGVSILNAGATVHVHIVNLEMDEAAFVQQLEAWEEKFSLKINYTLEVNQISIDQPEYVPAISASARYLELGDFLNMYDMLTLTDIDGWVHEPLAHMAVEDTDVRIASWVWRKAGGRWRLPWSNIAACHLSIKSTAASRKMAALVRHYMLHVIKNNTEAGREVFYLDQVVLFLTLQHMVDADAINVGFLRGGFEQSAEQRFGMRHESKRQDMIEKINTMRAEIGQAG